jgi:hypothetical protein
MIRGWMAGSPPENWSGESSVWSARLSQDGMQIVASHGPMMTGSGQQQKLAIFL